MKKLMTVLATAATALFAASAVADNVVFSESAENFESLTAGAAFEDGNGLNEYWLTEASADEMTVSNHADEVSFPSRPDKWNGADNNNYLQLDVSTPLARGLALEPLGGFHAVEIGEGIYLDTLVKFTAADEPFSANLDGGDKIAIEYVDETSDNPEGYKGFVIRAGRTVDKAFGQANYFADAPADFAVNAWHRLTVRSIANVGDGQVGFVIYLDGNVNPLAYDKDFDAGFDKLALDAAVAEKFYNSGFHALYPSAVNSGDNKGVISAAAFSGTGGIDDVVITKSVPNFIASGEGVVVPFTVDAGVTAISVSVAGVQDPIPVVDGAATLPAQTTAFTVNVTVDTAHGYTFGGITVGETDYDTNPASVEGYAGGAITITTIRNNFNLFNEDGDPIQGTFQTLTEAFAAEGVAMIKLAYDYDALAFEGDSFAGYDIDGEIVLDLNGNDLDGGDDSAGVSLFRVADTLTIIDSVGGGSISYDTQWGYAIVKNDGSDAFIGAAIGDAGATFNGKLFEDGYEGAIIKGNIDNANNADEGVFLWSSYVDANSDKERVGDYWVVAPNGGEPVEVNFTVGAANANSTVVVKTNDVVVAFADLPAKLTEGQTYEVTYTADEGYHFVTEQGNQTSIVVSGTVAKADITITAPTAEQDIIGTYTVTVTPAENASYEVTGAASNDGDVYTVATAHTITITATPAEDYEYAEAPTGWTLSEGVITIEVSETGTVAIPEPSAKQQGEYPSYIDENVAYKSAYDTWKTTNNVAAGDNKYEAAFLLNIAPDAEDQTLEPASITIAGGKVVITANQNLGTVNGKVYVKTATTLAGLKTAEWAEASLDETTKAINVTPDSSDTVGFYQIKVDF